MPSHKGSQSHGRKRGKHGASKKKQVIYGTTPKPPKPDLPPTLTNNTKKSEKSKRKRKANEEEGGDTPKAFLRLMKAKERAENAGSSVSSDKATTASINRQKQSAVTRLPNEKFTDFSRRVDEAIPLVRMKSREPSKYDQWKAKKRKIAEANGQKPLPKKGESQGDNDDDIEEDFDYEEAQTHFIRSNSPDPWKQLEKNKPKFGETALEPPTLSKPMKSLPNIPKSAGSVAKRLMLEAEREKFVNQYRAMVERKRAKKQGLDI
ncbi:uncharacterized protein V1510DRAFT_281679 [Dipodascopsis tothii]|uniref:uncharacterized protein n=1 Tax=Dipodascopsis tothii TaxID=44089 RepID=UPI0034CD4B35